MNHNFSPLVTVSEAKQVFKRYLIAYQERYGSKQPTIADVDHSALLDRMLNGGRYLPIPAPTFYSYPCYPLGDGESIQSPEVRDFYKGNKFTMPNGKVIIGQNGYFDKLDNQTVRYTVTGEIFRFDKPFLSDAPWEYDPLGTTIGRKPPAEEEYLHLKKVPIRVTKVSYNDPTSKRHGIEYEVVGDEGEYWKIVDTEKTYGDDKLSYTQKAFCIIVGYEEL